MLCIFELRAPDVADDKVITQVVTTVTCHVVGGDPDPERAEELRKYVAAGINGRCFCESQYLVGTTFVIETTGRGMRQMTAKLNEYEDIR